MLVTKTVYATNHEYSTAEALDLRLRKPVGFQAPHQAEESTTNERKATDLVCLKNSVCALQEPPYASRKRLQLLYDRAAVAPRTLNRISANVPPTSECRQAL